MLPLIAANLARAVLPEVANIAAKALGGGSQSQPQNPANDIV